MIKLTPEQIERWIAKNFDYKRKSGGRQFVINNPFNSDDGYHFWISTEPTVNKRGIKNYWVHDFRSSEHNSSFLGFVKKYKNVSYFQAVAEVVDGNQTLIRDELRRIRREQSTKQEEDENNEIVEESVSLPLSESFSDQPKNEKARQRALNYLKTRAVSEEKAKTIQLRYTPISVIFPYIEYGVTVFWQERSILEKEFNFPDEARTGLKKTDYLYNYDNVEQPCDHLIIVESIFNSISVGDNCVASGGAIVAGRQLQKLRVLGPKLIILAPDLDEAGAKSIKENYYLLKNDFKLAFCMPPNSLRNNGKKDWNDLAQQNGSEYVSNYILNNSCRLDPMVISRLLSRF